MIEIWLFFLGQLVRNAGKTRERTSRSFGSTTTTVRTSNAKFRSENATSFRRISDVDQRVKKTVLPKVFSTFSNRVQESRLEDYEVSPRRYKAIPIDSNVGRYKRHSSHSGERPAIREIINQYYPADSTLNILSSGRKRSGGISFVVQPEMKDEMKQ